MKNYIENMNYFEVDEKVRIKAEKCVTETNYQMQNIMKMSNHVEDQKLYLVLANNPNAIEGYQYVVWTFNGRGLDNGYYCSTFKSAFEVLSYKMNDIKYQELIIKKEIEKSKNASKLNPFLKELKRFANSFNNDVIDAKSWVDAWFSYTLLNEQIEHLKDKLVTRLETVLSSHSLSDGTKLGVMTIVCDENDCDEVLQYERYGFIIRQADRFEAIRDGKILDMFEEEILNK